MDQSSPSVDQRSTRRRVLDLAWPVISENFLETLLGVVDTILVARLGAAAIAGVGSALQVMFFVIAALSALAVGSAVLVAQAYGAGQLPKAGQLARQSLLWSILLGIPLAVVGVIFAEPIIAAFGLEPDVARIGVEYLQVTMGTAVVLTALLIVGGILRGADDSRTPMLVRAGANVINVGLTLCLIFGYLGFPALGAVGSAWGTFIARLLALIVLVWVLWRGRNGVTIRGAGTWWPQPRVAKDLLDIGIPAALEQLLISAAFFVLTILVAGLGTITLAAHRIAIIALSVSFLPGIGFGLAATSLVGQSLGARRPEEARDAGNIATQWGLIWMTVIGALAFFFAPQVIRLFTPDPEVIAIGASGLRVVALAQPFWAILMVHSGAIRGTGNTRFPLAVNASGIWAAVLLAYFFINQGQGGLPLVWAAFLLTSPILAGLHLWRFRGTMETLIRNQTKPAAG